MAKKYIYGSGMDRPAAMINVSVAGLYYYRFRDYSADLGRSWYMSGSRYFYLTGYYGQIDLSS